VGGLLCFFVKFCRFQAYTERLRVSRSSPVNALFYRFVFCSLSSIRSVTAFSRLHDPIRSHGTLAACAPIHPFVIAASDSRGHPVSKTSALMIFSDCLEYQRVQISNTSNKTHVLQINGIERTSSISRNRYKNGSTTNVSTVSKIRPVP